MNKQRESVRKARDCEGTRESEGAAREFVLAMREFEGTREYEDATRGFD